MRILRTAASVRSTCAAGLIAWIEGSYSGIVGLPPFEARALLKAAGLPVG